MSSNEDILISQLAAAQPRWLVDGKGVQGDRTTVFREEMPMDFPRGSFEVHIDRDEPIAMDEAGVEPGGAAPEKILYPFDVTVAGGAATIYPGSVNGIMPSNMFATFTASPSSTLHVKVRAVTNGQAVTGCTMVVDASAPAIQTPTPEGLPTVVEIQVAVLHDGKAYRTIGNGGLALSGQQQYTVGKDSPLEPGERNFIPYYAWVASVV